MAESTNRIGHLLIQDGVIDQQTEKEAAESQSRSPSRKFGEILVQDFGVNHHAVFGRLAKVYAFKEFEFPPDGMDAASIEFIKETIEDLPDDVRIKALGKRVLPLQLIDKRQERLLVVTPDPTDREVMEIATSFGYRRPEV